MYNQPTKLTYIRIHSHRNTHIGKHRGNKGDKIHNPWKPMEGGGGRMRCTILDVHLGSRKQIHTTIKQIFGYIGNWTLEACVTKG